jgi:cyclic pyranopterin phosphate synthase
MDKLTDPYGRNITYLRLSLTDRCDLRCFYCMAEHMVFLPKKELLTLEELGVLADAFIARGVRKIRLTGGEPLVRKGFMTLVDHLSTHLAAGRLDEIALTTNATQLAKHAKNLKNAGVKRVNISLDSLDPHAFNRITRGGNIQQVLTGIDAALDVGLKLKINTVALKSDNAEQIPQMIEWAHAKGMDLTLIEVMPLGETGEDRFDQYIPLTAIRDTLDAKWTLTDNPESTGGPARYVDIKETGGRVGFISPLSHNFCASCNRVRVTCTGQLFMCLGKDDNADLRGALRGPDGAAALDPILDEAIGRKPEKHDFEIKKTKSAPAVERHMSVTGG